MKQCLFMNPPPLKGTKIFREAKLQGRASGVPEPLCLLRLYKSLNGILTIGNK